MTTRRDVLESAKRGVIIGLSFIGANGKRDETGLTGYDRARWDELIAIEREIDRALAQQEPAEREWAERLTGEVEHFARMSDTRLAQCAALEKKVDEMASACVAHAAREKNAESRIKALEQAFDSANQAMLICKFAFAATLAYLPQDNETRNDVMHARDVIEHWRAGNYKFAAVKEGT